MEAAEKTYNKITREETSDTVKNKKTETFGTLLASDFIRDNSPNSETVTSKKAYNKAAKTQP